MAHQHSVHNKPSETGAGVKEKHLLPDEVDIFDQLQHEFDTLISGAEPEVSPPALSANAVEDFGELPAANEPSEEHSGEQQPEESDLSPDDAMAEAESSDDDLMLDDEQQFIAAPDSPPENPTQNSEADGEMTVSGNESHADDEPETVDNKPDEPIPSEEETPTVNQNPDPPSMQEAVDETPPLTEQSTVANTSDKTTLASAIVVSDNRPPNTKKASNIPISTIMMIGLAVAILMAAIAGSFWTYIYPAPSDRKSTENSRQVIIKKVERAVKYLPVNKSASDTGRQDAPHATDHAAPVAVIKKPQLPSQSSASHDNAKPIPSSPARSGDWIINLESFNAQNDASAYVAKLRQHDIHADMMAVQIKGKAWYRVRLTGFPSKQEAEKQRLILVKKLSLNSAWISKSRH